MEVLDYGEDLFLNLTTREYKVDQSKRKLVTCHSGRFPILFIIEPVVCT